MKPSRTLRLTFRRLFLLTLVSLAVAALLGVAVSANRANRAAKARAAEQAANAKSAITPGLQNDKHPNAPSAAVITATLTDNITAATKVAPGANINYTAVITNSGAASPADDATNLNYSGPLDANTTLVAGSVHASPIAFNDTYNWVGNTQLDTVARALPAVTANDVAVNAPAGTDTFTVTAIAGGATTLGGVVTLASPSGVFTYTPPLGRPNIADGPTVQDTFTYTITNNADPTLTSTGTVRINLTGRVWYLQAGAAGDGRSNTPSGSPAAMSTAADKSTDFFYIFSNAASLNGPFSVDAGQQLLGQGVNLVVSAITLFTAAAPTPTTTNTAGNCVALAGAPGNNTVSGFNIGNCTGGTAITGANVGTLNVSTLSINTNGGALDLTGVGTPTVSVVLGGTTSNAGARNVRLVGLNGTITLAGGALSGATGNAFDVSGGAATITYTGTISNSGAKQVNIASMTGGSVTLDGAVSGTGTGINLATNPGATITFRGGVVLSTGANVAFGATGPGPAATSGGTVNVCDENPCVPGATGALVNTLTTTTGTALNVVNTTIGTNNLEFRSIASNGATNGIVVNNTGTTGGLKVKGNSAGICGGQVTGFPATVTAPNTADCTGGTIQASTGAGILLASTSNTSLTRMRVTGGADDGIRGSAVTGFSLISSFIENNGNVISENGIDFGGDGGGAYVSGFIGMLGTSVITNSTVSGSLENNVIIRSKDTPPVEGSPLTLTVTGSTFRDTSSANGSDGIQFESAESSTMTLNVSSCAFIANRGDHVQANGLNSAVLNVTLTSNTFTGGNPGALGQGITVFPATGVPGYAGSVTYDINGNSINGAKSNGIIVNLGTSSAAATMVGKIRNNTIGTTGVALSCSSDANGIEVDAHGNGTHTMSITGNTIKRCFDRGVLVLPNDGSGVLNMTISGNVINEMADTNAGTGTPREALNIVFGAADPNIFGVPDAHQGCLSITSTAGNMVGGAFKNGDIRLRQRFRTRVVLPGYAGTAFDTTAVNNFLQANNPGTTATSTSNDDPGTATDGYFGGGPCALPPPMPNPADDSVRNGGSIDPSTNVMAQVESPITTPVAKAQESPTSVKQATLSVRNSLAAGKATPKATAAEVARIYRSERSLSHHAVRRSFDGQQPNAPASGETITLNAIATFPAQKSITIKYSATVNVPPLARQVSTQGTVTANGGAISVLTDDPEPAGAANPTVTLVDTLMTWNGVTSTDWNTATNWTPPAGGTQYAPGVSNPAVNDVLIPNVGNQPNISATDIGIFSLNISNGRTLTITSPRVLTIGGAPGGDLTLDGIISGGNLNLGTGTHVINNAGGTGSLSSTNVATVLSGGTVTLNNNLQAGALAVNAGGSMNITNRTLSLNGAGAALTVPGGATLTTTGSTVIFNGTAAQTAAGIAYNNLTINNTIGLNVTGVTLTGNATVNGALALTSSDLVTGAFTLTQPNTTLTTGASDVVGTVIRTGGPFTTGTILTFGNPSNQISFGAAGTKPTDVTVTMAKTAPATYAAAVQRNYTLSRTGGAGFIAILRLHYLDSELNGNLPETALNLRRGPLWKANLPTTVDTANNWVESNNVSDVNFSNQWTMSVLAPTASNGVVTGRIVDGSGRGVEGAVVFLSGTQNRKFITDAEGFYRFDGVETGGFYTVTPSRVNYTFSPATHSFSQVGESTDAAFGATATGQKANPLDTPEYFVRQHYLDFLGREPEEAGFNFWSDQILGCGNDQNCISLKREMVSAAYFLSIEHQRTGGLVDRLYRASYGRASQFSEFMPDTRAVGLGVRVGDDGWEAKLLANKEAFIAAFMNRPAFRAVYDGMDSSLFVETLIAHTGVSFTSAERDALANGLATGTMTRADVLRSIAEDNRFVSAKFNEAFVMMEYFGYLRRDGDPNGFAFWLNKLNEFNGNFQQAEMVKAFIVSGEYRDRFPR